MFQSIGKSIQIKVASTGLSKSLEAAMVLSKVNESSQGRWQATRFRRGQLTLVAPSPAAAQDLALRRSIILKEVNDLFGQPVVTRLIVRS